MSSFLEELGWRGLLYQDTEGASEALAAGQVTAYCGFDPTADSLHVGSLVPIMGLVHLQRAGHRPVALVGGGTGLIGDPSGRSTERQLADLSVIASNAEGIRRQLERFLDFSGPAAAQLHNNADWLVPLGAVAFLRDVGKHFSINYMLAKDSVKARLEDGISFTEFAYMLLQAFDFLELNRRHGVTMQIGGSDQYGNITAGIELVRRTTGVPVHGVTLPLVTRSDGSKFGKSEAGNVWLDAARTSPYQFYQFWVNADDRDAAKYLRYFTLMGRAEVEALDRAMAERPESRAAQAALAFDVTARVHGDEAARSARDVSRGSRRTATCPSRQAARCGPRSSTCSSRPGSRSPGAMRGGNSSRAASRSTGGGLAPRSSSSTATRRSPAPTSCSARARATWPWSSSCEAGRPQARSVDARRPAPLLLARDVACFPAGPAAARPGSRLPDRARSRRRRNVDRLRGRRDLPLAPRRHQGPPARTRRRTLGRSLRA